MTIRECVVASVVLLAMAPGAAHALTDANFLARTTADLVELCDPPAASALAVPALTFCQGFTQGAVSVEMQHAAASGIPMFCLPEPRPKRSGTVAEFVRWARAAPDRMDMAPEEGVLTFMTQRFPCPVRP